MKIHLYPSDEGTCGTIRMVRPAEEARRLGYDVTVFPPGPAESLPVQVGLDPVTKAPMSRMTAKPEMDVVVFQRPLDWKVPFAINMLRRHGVRCVVEVDDDLTALDRRHTAYQKIHPNHNPIGNWQHFMRACKEADAVVVTTPALADKFGRGGKGVVVENCVNSSWLDIEVDDDDDDPFTIGWTGRVSTHPGDLDVLRGGLQTALSGSDARFAVLGWPAGVQVAAGLTDVPFEVPPVPFLQYPRAVARFDIGIAPLADTAFNRAKSWLKPLDYAAVGVPFVCSDTDEYQRFAEQGCGIVVKRSRQWASKLRELMNDPIMRADLAAAGRSVAAEWTFERHAERFVEAWAGCRPTVAASMVKQKEGT